jgi:hypothetical protein
MVGAEAFGDAYVVRVNDASHAPMREHHDTVARKPAAVL